MEQEQIDFIRYRQRLAELDCMNKHGNGRYSAKPKSYSLIPQNCRTHSAHAVKTEGEMEALREFWRQYKL